MPRELGESCHGLSWGFPESAVGACLSQCRASVLLNLALNWGLIKMWPRTHTHRHTYGVEKRWKKMKKVSTNQCHVYREAFRLPSTGFRWFPADMVGSCCWHHQTCCEDRLSASLFFVQFSLSIFLIFLHFHGLHWPSLGTLERRPRSGLDCSGIPGGKKCKFRIPSTSEHCGWTWFCNLLHATDSMWAWVHCVVSIYRLLLWDRACFQESFPAAKLPEMQ